jgi:hypothetical protein
MTTQDLEMENARRSGVTDHGCRAAACVLAAAAALQTRR